LIDMFVTYIHLPSFFPERWQSLFFRLVDH
jgi:hypothetical protein